MNKKIKIMYIAPYKMPLNSKGYGGIEKTVSRLDKEFSGILNYETLVFAPKDSHVYGELCASTFNRAWYFGLKDRAITSKLNQERKFKEYCKDAIEKIKENKPDIVHDFIGLVKTEEFYNEKGSFPPVLSTLHSSPDPGQSEIFEYADAKENNRNKKIFFNAISKSQKKSFERKTTVDYLVPNSIEVEDFDFGKKGKNYVFLMSSLSQEKGPDIAIKAAKLLNKKIILAGPVHDFNSKISLFWEEDLKPKIDEIKQNYFEEKNYEKDLEDFLKSKEVNVLYLGEINSEQKKFFMKNASAFYYPVKYDKDFPKVVAEANASGVPVVTFGLGANSEIIEHGKTGYIVGLPFDLLHFAEWAGKVNEISRQACRDNILNKFPVEKQIQGYLGVYEDMLRKKV